ncbi:MAG: hypothetical protein GXY76_09490 [Chloroflexi bacterium]|nr:hypothetical protein [Chloroflexota bacterium]
MSVQIQNIRQVYNDGNHNAFTDLVHFKGAYYLTFRSCIDGHMVYDSSRILILHSLDTVHWRLAHAFHVPDRDVRDPHFLALGDALFVYSGTWLADGRREREQNDQQGYGCWTTDGKTWRGPRFLEGTQGHYIWRAAAHEGKAYLCGRRKRGLAPTATMAEARPLTESALLVSDDGLRFQTAGLFQEEYGDETAFCFEPDGAIVALARRPLGMTAQLLRARPPYRDWSRRDLDRNVGGPLLARWGDRYLVGGRKWLDGDRAITMLYWLVDDRLVEIAALPSGGDNSYPGFVETGPGRGLVSWYSSHEGSGVGQAPCAIYLADLALAE